MFFQWVYDCFQNELLDGQNFLAQNPQFSIDFILSKARGSLLASGLNPVAFNSAVTAQLNLAAAAQRQINQRNAALQMTQKVNFFRNFSQLEQKQNQGENQLIFILDF